MAYCLKPCLLVDHSNLKISRRAQHLPRFLDALGHVGELLGHDGRSISSRWSQFASTWHSKLRKCAYWEKLGLGRYLPYFMTMLPPAAVLFRSSLHQGDLWPYFFPTWPRIISTWPKSHRVLKVVARWSRRMCSSHSVFEEVVYPVSHLRDRF